MQAQVGLFDLSDQKTSANAFCVKDHQFELWRRRQIVFAFRASAALHRDLRLLLIQFCRCQILVPAITTCANDRLIRHRKEL